MNIKKFALGALAGGLVNFLLGWLVYGMLAAIFFEANVGSAGNVMKTEPDLVFIFLGNLFTGALISYIYLKWANIRTFAAGATAGLVIGFLMGSGTDLLMYGTSNINNLTATLVDIVIYAGMGAICGGVVGWVLGMGKD